MANTKISQLTANTNPNGNEELVYAYNNANGKMSLNTMKTFAISGTQPELVSGTNIKTINGESILWSWNMVIQWGGGWGWDSSYDAIVDASGNGDYTLVSAAIAAGKYNLFVKNGNYTETAWWDPYSNNASFLHIVWESKSGVQITMPDTMTTANGRMIDMRYNSAADFYMENISFNITLTNTNHTFYTDSGWSSFIVKNCSFTYTTTVDSPSDTKHYLLRSNVVNYSWDAHYYLPWRTGDWIYGCYFNTETTKIINIWYKNLNLHECKLYSLAWRIQLAQETYSSKLFNCYVDTYELWWCYEMEIYNSYVHITTWNVYSWAQYEISIDRIDNSILKIWTLQNTPSITLAACTNSDLDFWGYDVSGVGTFGWMESAKINCNITCWAFAPSRETIWCHVSATWLTISAQCRMMWNRFKNTLWAVTINQSNCIITGNIFEWTTSWWAITISWDENVFTSNWMRYRALTVTWTDNETASNVTA